MFDLIDFIWSPAAWRRMSGPLAFLTALLGGLFGALFAVAGGAALVTVNSWPLRMAALVGLTSGIWTLGSVVAGVIAFFRATDEAT